MEITLPYQFSPRPYQLPLFKAMDSGCNRAVLVWCRRSGKDITTLNLTAKKAFERKGAYYHCFPTYAQGRKVLWDGADKSGRKFLDAFPKELVESRHEQEMKLKLKNGSLWQVIGADDVDRVVGTNPLGIVFSEYSLMSPVVWDYFRPILAENGGWAVFQFTPRGSNHAKKLYDSAKAHPESWYTSLLTVDETKTILREILERERKEIIEKNGDDALYRQEFYCSFSASVLGSYYGHILHAHPEIVCEVPHDKAKPVHTVWDLGISDATSVIYWQKGSDGLLRAIRAEEWVNRGLPDIWADIRSKHPEYAFGNHYAPHDISAREWGTGKTRISMAEEIGLNFDKVPNLKLADGIDRAKTLLPRIRIDREGCKPLLDAIENYGREWDETRKIFAERPRHDCFSHMADALRYSSLVEDLIEPTGVAPDRTKSELFFDRDQPVEMPFCYD